MDMIETRYDLAEDAGDEAACRWPAFASFDETIEIAFHALENKAELLGIWQEEEIIQGYDAGMRRNGAKRLYGWNMRRVRGGGKRRQGDGPRVP